MPFKIASRYPKAVDRAFLEAHGVMFEHIDFDPKDEDAAIAALSPYDGFVVIGEPFTRRMCEALKGKVRYVCRNGVGFDTIDVEACAEHGICVTNTSGSMDQAVAESALLLILEASRRYYLSDREVRQGKWNQDLEGRDLEGKTVGFVGFGRIAQKLAQYLTGFQCRILVYDKYVKPAALQAHAAEAVDSLTELATRSDVITVHCPLTAETRGMLSDDFFRAMKPTAYFVNTARGAIVDEAALIRTLKSGKIAGAGLDVFEVEPLNADSPLRSMDNVCIAAHIASYTEEAMNHTRLLAAQNIVDFAEGRMPRNCVNRDYVNHC